MAHSGICMGLSVSWLHRISNSIGQTAIFMHTIAIFIDTSAVLKKRSAVFMDRDTECIDNFHELIRGTVISMNRHHAFITKSAASIH